MKHSAAVALAILLAPVVASAQNSVAYRIGPGAQMNCLTTVPTHISTRGTVWCSSSDLKLHYTDSTGADVALGASGGGGGGSGITGLTTGTMPIATSSTTIGDGPFLLNGAITLNLTLRGGTSGVGGLNVQPQTQSGNYGASLSLDNTVAEAAGAQWSITALNSNLGSYDKGFGILGGTNLKLIIAPSSGDVLIGSTATSYGDRGHALTVGGDIEAFGTGRGFIFGDGTTQTTAATATGSVTSVALTAPGFLSVSGSPVTTSGTLAVALATQSANAIFAGPSSGVSAAPTFRALAAADLPSGTASAALTSGQLAIASGAAALTSSSNLTYNTGTSAFAVNGVGVSSSAVVTGATISGSANTLSNVPSSALTSTVTAASCTYCSVTYNAQGQVTTASSGTTPHTGTLSSAAIPVATGANTLTSSGLAISGNNITTLATTAVDTAGTATRITAATGGTYSASAAGTGAVLFQNGGAGGIGDATHASAGGGASQNSGGVGGAAQGGAAGVGGDGLTIGGNGGAGTASVAAAAGGAARIAGGNGGVNNGFGGGNGGAAYVRGGTATGAGTNGAVNIGDAATSAVNIGASGITTTVTGPLTQQTGAFSLTGTSASTVTTSSGNTSVDSAAALNLGATNATSVNVGRSGQTSTLKGSVVLATQVVAGATSTTVTPSSGTVVKVNLVTATNVTTMALSAGADGQILTVAIIQPASGTAATMATSWTNTSFAGGAGSFTSTLGKRDLYSFFYDGTSSKWYEISRSLNLSN